MKGYLDVEQLKGMKREELQALAKKMGVGAGGKNEEIIARIAEAEVGIPEESQLTEEEKAEAEAAQQEEERVAEEQAAREQEEAEQAAKEAEAAGLVKVKAVIRYLDKQFNQIKDAGEAYSVSRERAAQLVAAGVAEIVG